MVDKKISISEQVANLPIEGALLFTWMIPHADDAGLLPYSARAIKALVVPMRDEMTIQIIEDQLQHMVNEGLLATFEYGGGRFWRIVNFHKIQVLQKDRNPQTLLYFEKGKDVKANWDKLNQIIEDFGIQMESNWNTNGIQLDTEMKRNEVKGIEEKNTGGEPPYNPPTATPDVSTKKADENKKGELSSVGAILQTRKPLAVSGSEAKKNGVGAIWQDKALRYARALNIDLDDMTTVDRRCYFKAFKQASQGRKTVNLENAYTYLSDYPKALSSSEKLKLFFYIYENGLKKPTQAEFITVRAMFSVLAIFTVSIIFLFLAHSADAMTVRVKYQISDKKEAKMVKQIKKTEKPQILRDFIQSVYASDKTAGNYRLHKDAVIEKARQIAREYQINEEAFLCVIGKESGYESKNADGSLKCGDNGESCGLGQIKIGTWESIRRHAGWDIQDRRADDIENLKTTAYGLSTLWRNHWTGYRLCREEGYSL